jgi:hypothetical protein
MAGKRLLEGKVGGGKDIDKPRLRWMNLVEMDLRNRGV